MELLGSYDPHKKEFKVKKDRIEYWVSKGAGVSPTVNNLMVNYKIWDKPKMQSWKPKSKKTTESGSAPSVKEQVVSVEQATSSTSTSATAQ